MFKVGDRVKIVKETYHYTEKHVGLEGKITWVMNDGSLAVDVGKGARYCHKPEGLELINQPTWQEVEREPKLGSRNDTLIVEQNTDTKELRLTTGCFTGTLDEFEAAVKRKTFGNKHRLDYEFYIERYKVKYPDYKKEVRYIIKLNDKCYFAGCAKIAECKRDALKFEFESNAQKFRKRFGGIIEEITLDK